MELNGGRSPRVMYLRSVVHYEAPMKGGVVLIELEEHYSRVKIKFLQNFSSETHAAMRFKVFRFHPFPRTNTMKPTHQPNRVTFSPQIEEPPQNDHNHVEDPIQRGSQDRSRGRGIVRPAAGVLPKSKRPSLYSLDEPPSACDEGQPTSKIWYPQKTLRIRAERQAGDGVHVLAGRTSFSLKSKSTHCTGILEPALGNSLK